MHNQTKSDSAVLLKPRKRRVSIVEKHRKKQTNSTLAISEVRKIGLNSLLVKWMPTGVESTIGYAIFINKKLKSRIYNRIRNMAILDYLPLNSLFVITVKEIGSDGKEKQHGASTVYKITF